MHLTGKSSWIWTKGFGLLTLGMTQGYQLDQPLSFRLWRPFFKIRLFNWLILVITHAMLLLENWGRYFIFYELIADLCFNIQFFRDLLLVNWFVTWWEHQKSIQLKFSSKNNLIHNSIEPKKTRQSQKFQFSHESLYFILTFWVQNILKRIG